LAIKLQLIILIFVYVCAWTVVRIPVIVATKGFILLIRPRVIVVLPLGSPLTQTISNVLRGIDYNGL